MAEIRPQHRREGLLIRLSLRVRLLLIIGGVLLVGMIAGGILLLRHARTSVEVEMQSNLQTVRQLIGIYLTDPESEVSESDLETLAGAVSHLRHVHALVDYTAASHMEAPIANVPGWFATLVAPPQKKLPRITLFGPGRHKQLVIETNPADEIQEVWHDLVPLAELVIGVYLLVCVLVFWALGRALKPLDNLYHAFEQLEHEDGTERLSEVAVPELARIHQRFNTMAERLRASMQTNRELSNHLVVVQEGERKSLARELHDEMGSNLFNIQVDVTTGLTQLEEGNGAKVRERLESIEAIVSNMQVQTRALISRLRPLVLEEMGLHLVLEGLVEKWRVRYRQTNWNIEIEDNLEDLQDALAVTVYRIVQECLTNIVRHANARNVTINIRRRMNGTARGETSANGELVELEIKDDGTGRNPTAKPGFGLQGMQERVSALGGKFHAGNGESGGFLIRAKVPITK